jgi:hypothetical protein
MRSVALYGFGKNSESPCGLPESDVRTTRISGRHVVAIPASPSPAIPGIRTSVNKTEIAVLRSNCSTASSPVLALRTRRVARIGFGRNGRPRARTQNRRLSSIRRMRGGYKRQNEVFPFIIRSSSVAWFAGCRQNSI